MTLANVQKNVEKVGGKRKKMANNPGDAELVCWQGDETRTGKPEY